MTTVAELVNAMERIAPIRLAAEWDNVGLLLGRGDAAADRILVCLDITSEAVAAAVEDSVDAIVSYHPILFDRPGRITEDTPQGQCLLDLMQAGIAVYSPHTAWDAVEGGLADWLSEGIGTGEVSPLEPASEHRLGATLSVVTYVPREATDAVRDAMAAAGGGRVGDYDWCSTRIESVGSFRPNEGANPTIGSIGTVERVEEHRLQMVCGEQHLAAVLHALRGAHPYEEPPIHVFKTQPEPSTTRGGGRLIRLADAVPTDAIIARLKSHLGVEVLRVCRGCAASETHSIVGCCPGAGGSMLGAAESAGATLYVTGEMRHHDLVAARERGVTIILAGHAHTEQRGLQRLASSISRALVGARVTCAAFDAAPWRSV